MNFYSIVLKRSAEKDLRKLPDNAIRRVLRRIAQLKDDPLPPGKIMLKDAERLYRVRVGAYRIVYEVDITARVVVIHYIRHRRDVYRR